MKTMMMIGILALLSMAFLACSCSNGLRSEEKEISPTDIHQILHYAALAGSSHNSQPWKTVVYSNDSILVFADPERLLNVVDPQGVELFISVGAFIENLHIAARAMGYATSITLHEAALHSGLPLATIQLEKLDLTPDPDRLTALELRTTLRIPFDTTAVSDQHREQLLALAADEAVFIPAASPKGREAAQMELEAYTQQARQKEALDELATWIRFSDKDVNTKRDGLSPAGMGIKGFGGFVVRHFMKPEDSKKESFVNAGIEKTKKQVESCGGWILLTTENDAVVDWLKLGRLYERLNIRCCELSLGFHPMNQLLEVPEIAIKVNESLAPGKKIRFVARIGYVDSVPPPVSKRRPVESFTVFM